MTVRRLKVDSLLELQQKKSNAALARENEELREQIADLDGHLTETQLALCEVYELLIATE